MKNKLSAAIVIYNENVARILPLISFLNTSDHIGKIYIIDNSSTDYLKKKITGNKTEYIFNNANLGYGKAHNIGIKKSIESGQYEYHIVINPDIRIADNCIEQLTLFMEESDNVGLVMPKILYENGDVQYLYKLLPTPFDLIIRRFLFGPVRNLFKDRLLRYELRHKDYSEATDVPNLSGCFMFMRTDVLKQTGGFDEHYFMYLEDTDLCRRIGELSRTVYYPKVLVYHGYAKESYKNPRLLMHHIRSAIKYFNKWGWFFDEGRKRLNEKIK